MSSTSPDATKSIKIYGHVSASPEKIGVLLGAEVAIDLDTDCDAALFVVNPSAGIDPRTIEQWHSYDEIQTPRIVIVTVLEGMEMDFDDAVLLANRVFDTLVTPHLVLHGENGSPIGTISLVDLTTTDYSTTPPTVAKADGELEELVKEFQEEFNDQMIEMEEGAFAAGILFPAIPVNTANGLGLDLVAKYLNELPGRS